MKGRRSSGVDTAGLVALALLLGCAPEAESLGSVRTSADVRLPEHARGSNAAAETLLKAPLSVDAATRVALLNSRRIAAAYEELGVARADVVHALRLPNPEFEGMLRFGRDKPEIEVLGMLGLSELVFLPLRADAANASYAAKRMETTATILALAFDVRDAFYAYQAAEQSRELADTVLRATEASADAAARLHDAGNVPDLDLATERAFAEEARIAARSAASLATAERARLSGMMGVSDAAGGWSAAGRLPEPPADELPLQVLESKAVDQSLELASTKQRAEAASRRATAASTERWLPGLKAGVSARDEGTWTVGPAVALELPLLYQGQGTLEAARAEERREKDLGAAGAVELRARAHAAAERLRVARENALRYRDELLPLRKRVLDETELHYNAMAVGVFQLLAAKREQIATARAYVDALREYWQSRNEVERLEAGAPLR